VEPNDYLRVFRSWWGVVVATVVVALTAAWFLTPTEKQYEATHTMFLNLPPDSGDTFASSRMAFLATRGNVPQEAAKALGQPTAVGEFVSKIDVTADDELNTVEITATDSKPDRAAAIANEFARALGGSLDDSDRARKRRLELEAEGLRQQIAELDAQVLPNQNNANSAARDSLVEQFQAVLAEARRRTAPTLTTVQQATPYETSALGRVPRMAIAGVLGLLLGAGLVLVVARFDTRIRTKEDAERAFGVPVLAEIPPLARRQRKQREVVTVSDPYSLGGEAYRSLRTSLLLGPAAQRSARGPARGRPRRDRRADGQPVESAQNTVVLVVSAGVGEGKTTSVANLAAAYAEAGKFVVAVNCDLRRPELHHYLGAPEEPGLGDVFLGNGERRQLGDVVQSTSVPDVRVVTSGRSVENPGELLAKGAGVITEARNFGDVVVIDTSPMLATDDASALIPMVDNVVVVCRAGKTTSDAATRTVELLARLSAPVRGVVLVGSTVPTGASYYRDYTRKGRKSRKGWRGRKDRKDETGRKGWRGRKDRKRHHADATVSGDSQTSPATTHFGAGDGGEDTGEEEHPEPRAG
jgi:capsular exopolysaccharide synthesis family protein